MTPDYGVTGARGSVPVRPARSSGSASCLAAAVSSPVTPLDAVFNATQATALRDGDLDVIGWVAEPDYDLLLDGLHPDFGPEDER